jgi:hypothetical protein
VSRFFLNLRSVVYDDPISLAQATTGFTLDNVAAQTLMAKIMSRKPNQNTARTLDDMGTRRRRDEEGVSGDRTSRANIDYEAGRELVELRPTERQGI